MSIRFRRRIRILPGIYINLSKSGVSTTIGPRGAKINIGKQGVFLNTGIPGTGIYSREKLNNLTGGKNDNIDKNNEKISIERDEDLALNSMLKTGQGLMDVKEKL